jgi:hypothetical protein
MSYYDVDFDRHPMPRSVVARIRERLAGKSGDAAARTDAHGAEKPSDCLGSVGNSNTRLTARISAVPGIRSE